MQENSMTDENMRQLLKNNRTLIDKVNLLLEKLEHYTSAFSTKWLNSSNVCRFLKYHVFLYRHVIHDEPQLTS